MTWSDISGGQYRIFSADVFMHGLLPILTISLHAYSLPLNIEKLFCALYGMPEKDDINLVRFKLFFKKKNPNALPPTQDALISHIDRSHLQSLIWIMAHIPKPILPDATECGYEMTDIGLKPILMTKAAIPESALKITSCNCTTNCKDNRCGCRKSGLKCNLYCGCAKLSNFVSCMNAPADSFNDEEDD